MQYALQTYYRDHSGITTPKGTGSNTQGPYKFSGSSYWLEMGAYSSSVLTDWIDNTLIYRYALLNANVTTMDLPGLQLYCCTVGSEQAAATARTHIALVVVNVNANSLLNTCCALVNKAKRTLPMQVALFRVYVLD